MDVNGTRFHLFNGRDDWSRCLEDGLEGTWENTHWNPDAVNVQLSPVLALFPRSQRDVALIPSERRGAAVDRFGNWYWISHDRQCLYWQPSGTGTPELYWEPPVIAAPTKSEGAFVPVTPETSLVPELAGLAVTTHHYLVVGSISQRGIYLFDLHAGGEPTLLLFPNDIDFRPFDMAASPGGGVWILDRDNHVYWGLNQRFEMISEPAQMQPILAEETSNFKPVGGEFFMRPGRSFPTGFPIAAADPISIVSMPDLSVLILDSSETATVSSLYHYKLSHLLSPPFPLQGDIDVTVIGETGGDNTISVVAHDIAYLSKERRLVAVERDGNQAIAFHLDSETTPLSLTVRADYLPLHFFGGRALVSDDRTGSVFYDVVGGLPENDDAVRWLRVRALDQPRFVRQTTLLTPVLDGRERDCVWHRLFLEACIPPETAVRISTRAHNDPMLLDTVAFAQEPALYLRAAGPEIPLYKPFGDASELMDGTGTWELLFQQTHGQYMQIKIELTGNGRITPHLYTLRAYYPRFSYPRHYLPTVFLQDKASASFLERMLANMEGIYAEIEGQISTAHTWFDARSAPPETLDWLASWLGLMMDPLWAKVREPQIVTNTDQSGTANEQLADRRRLFIRFARILYKRRGTVDGIRFALHLFLDPCLELMLRYFKQAAITPDAPVAAHLARYGLPTLTPASTELALEDLLYMYLLKRPSTIRIIENFQTRGGRGLVAGDASQSESGDTDVAHRFSVLIPEGLSSQEEKMVNRIVNLEKPAHTAFTIRRYWDGFRVGMARLGIDTTLADSSRYQRFMVGRDYLAEGYLPAGYPMNVDNRMVSDRDRLGHMPSL